ncbi:hypothetical protein [Paracidovorax avenae]|uniref:hypothetical protein n=1 Tax=Paracidovorax avenae TaxID=80867 RepID=UPI001AD7EBAF|nr:hypothetical protein [Paracidovorax avenae]
MKKFLTYLLPLMIIAAGASISYCIGRFFAFGKIDIYTVITVGILFCVLEVNIIKNFPEEMLVYISLDGKMFPFFSVGLGGGLILLRN